MADHFILGPFERQLPQPSASRNSAVLSSGVRPHGLSPISENMMLHMPRSRDLAISHELPGLGQQLPPVSHILAEHSYHNIERPSSQEGPGIFHRTQHTHSNSGDGTPGPPSFYRYSPNPQALQTQDQFHRGISSPSSCSHASRQQDQIQHKTSIPSMLSRSDGGTNAVSNATLDQPRVPIVLREEDIPGKGFCYIYDDGTYCPKAIDGDSVNPQWGVTKAGKPRKRLAHACTTCREKKIRCDPGSGLSKCAQCLKFNRECKFEQQQNSRSSQRSSSASSTNSPPPEIRVKESFTLRHESATSTEHLYPMVASSKTSMEVDESTSPSLFRDRIGKGDSLEQPHPTKRIKTSAQSSMHSGNIIPVEEPERRYATSITEVVSGISADLSLQSGHDPFDFDKEMTEYYLHQYFTKINYTTYCLFPKAPFLRWVRTCRNKTLWDKMLLYAMMAHGTIFATNSQKHVDGKRFSDIAHYAVHQSAGVFNLQVVQTRLILASYNFSQGNISKAWEYAGWAVRAACGMKLNVEEGILDIKDDQSVDYALDKATLIECRRRSFWAAYIVDRFNGLCVGHLANLHTEDCLLRMPCNEKMYEEGTIPLTPFFDHGTIDPQHFVHTEPNTLGTMAYLVQIVTIWGEVLARNHRSRHQPPSATMTPFEDFYQHTVERLEVWEHSLGAHLRSSSVNIHKASQNGYLGTYGALHILYHCTMMKLNRHARYDCLQPQQIDRNVKGAYNHACKILDMVKAIAKQNRVRKSGFAVSTPFTGYAVLTAMDILTATGSMADLLNPGSRTIELLAGGIDTMTQLSEHWSSAKTQLKLVEGRFEDLMATVQSHGAPSHTKVTAFFARDPLEATFGREYDLVYALPRRRYLEALGKGALIKEGDDMLEVLKRGSSANMISLSSTTIWDLA